MKEPYASVLIITYRRSSTISYVLEGLKKQSYKDFEVIIVVKEPSEEFYEIIDKYIKDLYIRVLVQDKGFAPEAYEIGIPVCRGQVIAFLDDDAIPKTSWLEDHVKSFQANPKLGGVAGNDIQARIENGGAIVEIPERKVHPVYLRISSLKNYCLSRPLSRMNGWYVYFGRDGLAHHHPKFLLKDEVKSCVPSLLFLGANMSVKKKAIEGLHISGNLVVSGFGFEHLLAYGIIRKGYGIVYNPSPKVMHVVHEESLGRFSLRPSFAALKDAEYVVAFHMVKAHEKEVSWIGYIIELYLLMLGRILGARNYGFKTSLYRVYGLLYGFIIGVLKDEEGIRNFLTHRYQQ